MSLTNFMEEAMVEYAFGNTIFGGIILGTHYVALLTTELSEDGSNVAAAEIETPTQNGYARQPFGNNQVGYLGIADGSQNDVTFTFGPATSDWGTATHYAVMDSETAATRALYGGELVQAKDIKTDDTVFIDTGEIQITLT